MAEVNRLAARSGSNSITRDECGEHRRLTARQTRGERPAGKTMSRSAGLLTANALRLRTWVYTHRRTDVVVTEQLLNGADVVPVLQKMRGKAMLKCVRADALRDP